MTGQTPPAESLQSVLQDATALVEACGRKSAFQKLMAASKFNPTERFDSIHRRITTMLTALNLPIALRVSLDL